MIQSILISLNSVRDRRARALAALATTGLSYSVIDAIDGRRLPARSVAEFGRHVSGGEQGCLASHLSALSVFLESDAPIALVLEDDIASINAKALVSIAARLENLKGWDVAHLGTAQFGYRSRWLDVAGVKIDRAHLFPMTSPALLWSREGAQAFLESQPDWPVDHAIRQLTLDRRSGVGVQQPLVQVADVDSLMTDRTDLLTTQYAAIRMRRRRRQKARAAWHRFQWRLKNR